MPTYSATRGALDLVDILGADLSIPFTITEDAVAFAWAGVTVVTEIIDRDGTAAAVASFTFTTGASGAATLSLTEAQKTTLTAGTYRYSIVASVGDALQWSVYGQYALLNAYDNGQASTNGVAVTITAGTVAVTITSSAPLASAVSINDAGGYFTGTTAETALQEAATRNVMHGAMPTAAIAQTIPRNVTLTNASIISSGRESMFLIWLNAGQTVTSITFASGTQALVAGTNQWFSLRSSARVLLGITADDTSTAWAANSMKTLTLATPYLATATGFHYIGLMVAAGTAPSLISATGTGPSVVYGQAPVVTGFDGTNLGLTTPATAPATSAALTAASSIAYAYVS